MLNLLRKNGTLIRQRRNITLAERILPMLVTLLLSPTAIASPQKNGFDLSDALIPVRAIESGGPGRDGIPALDNPRFVPAEEARFLDSTDRVLGIQRNGIVRAYPVAILNWHEIVNDHYGSDAVVVTYCPLCGTGMAFIAKAKGEKLDFGVSGLLYNSDVLLYDRQTESLWSQLMSQAVSGPLRGQRLEMIPLTHTSWEDWRSRHPQSEVLSTDTGYSRDYSRDPYVGYDRAFKIMFRVSHLSERYHPKEPVIGIVMDGVAKAYSFSTLAVTKGDIHDEINGHPVIIRYDDKHRTGTIHDAVTGDELPSVTAYWFAWYAFYPDTKYFERDKQFEAHD